MVNRIKLARVVAELSQGDLAKKVGVTSAAVSQWEKGETRPNAKRLKKLADILNVTVDELLEEKEVS